MNHTVVAVFDEYGQAQQAMNALFNEGFTQSNVKLSPAEENTQARKQFLSTRQTSTSSGGWGIGDFFRSLFGSDQHSADAGIYSEAVRRGSYLLSVDARDDHQAEQAAVVMQKFNAIDLNQRAAHWKGAGWTGYQPDAPIYTSEQIQRDRECYTAGSASTTGALSDEEYRQHWQSAYGSSGGKYEDHAQAYRYGATVAGDKQYQGYHWDELEPRVRSDWEATHAGSPWERTKHAVKYGWERVTGK